MRTSAVQVYFAALLTGTLVAALPTSVAAQHLLTTCGDLLPGVRSVALPSDLDCSSVGGIDAAIDANTAKKLRIDLRGNTLTVGCDGVFLSPTPGFGSVKVVSTDGVGRIVGTAMDTDCVAFEGRFRLAVRDIEVSGFTHITTSGATNFKCRDATLRADVPATIGFSGVAPLVKKAKARGCLLEGHIEAISAAVKDSTLSAPVYPPGVSNTLQATIEALNKVSIRDSTITGGDVGAKSIRKVKIRDSVVSGAGVFGVVAGSTAPTVHPGRKMKISGSTITGNGLRSGCGTNVDCADLASGVVPTVTDTSCDTSHDIVAGGSFGVCALD